MKNVKITFNGSFFPSTNFSTRHRCEYVKKTIGTGNYGVIHAETTGLGLDLGLSEKKLPVI